MCVAIAIPAVPVLLYCNDCTTADGDGCHCHVKDFENTFVTAASKIYVVLFNA